MARIHFFQHVDFEEPGHLVTWANKNSHSISTTRFFQSYQLPDLSDWDLLIILGGPMSVHDTSIYPSLSEEIAYIKQALSHKKKIVGICLGAQLIALSLGAAVSKNSEPEIGWYPIFPIQEQDLPLDLHTIPDPFWAFHWHGEVFSLPEGALSLYQTSITPCQAFYIPDSVLGLQFHWEANAETIEQMLEAGSTELQKGPWIQPADEIRKYTQLYSAAAHRMLELALNRFLRS